MTRPYQQSKSESGAEKTELLNTESLDHQNLPSDLRKHILSLQRIFDKIAINSEKKWCQ